MKKSRLLAGSLLSFLTLGAVMLGAAIPAQADVALPGIPNPVNILPSTVVGGTTTGDGAALALLLKAGKSPAFWAAVKAQNAGTATAAQLAAISGGTADFGMTATKLAPLVKVVPGAGGLAVGSYALGASIGNGIVHVFGLAPDGIVCQQSNGFWLGLLTGDLCIDDGKSPTFTPNMDQNGVTTYSSVCTGGTSNVCFTIVGSRATTVNNRPAHEWCYASSPGPFVMSGQVLVSGVWQTMSELAGCASQPTSFFIYDDAGTFGGYRVRNGGGYSTSIPTTTRPNPGRNLTCYVKGSDGSEYTGHSSPWTEGADIIPAPSCPSLPPGVVADNIQINETLQDGSGASNTLYDQDTSPEYQSQASAYPDCQSGTCMLDLRSAVTHVSCFTSPGPCADWYTDPDKGTKFECYFGPHLVALSECTMYAPSFDPQKIAKGDTVGDPQTGEPIGSPSEGTGTDGQTMGDPVQDPDEKRECFPTGWGVLNPVEWVVKPVQCALQWAFVPRQTVLNQSVTGVQDAWDDTVFGKVGPIVAQFSDIPSASGCAGLPIDIDLDWPANWGIHWTLGAACDPPWSTLAGTVRTITGIGLSIYGVIAIVRYIAGAIGYEGFGKSGDS